MEFTSNGHHRKFDYLSKYKKRKIMYEKNVIPTASWGNVDSFEYCLGGLL